MVTIIAAIAKNNALGMENGLIWHLSADLKRFKKLTTGHSIIMGRKTYESIGKPLPERTNIVISRNLDYHPRGCIMTNSIEAALKVAGNVGKVFIVGGAQIYKQCFALANELELTHIHKEFKADTFFPEFNKEEWELVSLQHFEKDKKNEFDYTFASYKRKE